MAGATGQPPPRAVALLTRATLPLVADIAIEPTVLGGGRLTVPPVPAASWTR